MLSKREDFNLATFLERFGLRLYAVYRFLTSVRRKSVWFFAARNLH